MEQVKKMMNIRGARDVDDDLFYHTEAQLKAANIAFPETPADAADPMAKAGLVHHSARPAANPDPGVELTASEIGATETAMKAAGGTKLTPKQMQTSLKEAKLEC